MYGVIRKSCHEECTDILLSPVETVQRDLMEFARCHAGNV